MCIRDSYSGSMKTNDPEQTAQGMVKAFIDTVHSADIRIGFVAYNDRLLSTTSPISVGTNEERQVLRQLIDAHGYSGNTDIGLGLRNACLLYTSFIIHYHENKFLLRNKSNKYILGFTMETVS